MLDKLSSLFQKLSSTVSIEGHTDNVPINWGSKYADNWELSTARSMSVLRYFIGKNGLAPDKFVISGYADTHPVASNSTGAGRAKNRRVEITVLRERIEPAAKAKP